MSMHDQTVLDIERMAAAATDEVMEKLHLIVRQAVMREVSEELADQRELLAEERARVERMAQAKATPLPPNRDLVSAAAKVATAAIALESAKFSQGERIAREALETATNELLTAYRQYAAITRKGK